jgi:hypothetical protein
MEGNEMTAVELAERKARWRALGFLFIAALIVATMVAVSEGQGGDFVKGLWLGMVFGSTLSLLPFKRWLQPRDAVAQLLDDEGARENRRLASTAGFWAAMVTAIGFGFFTPDMPGFSAYMLGQYIATAGMVTAMLTFAFLEIRGHA